MFFGNKRKRGGGITGIFRLFLSIIILGVMGLGLLQAYKGFSGFDPLTLDPESAKGLFSQEGITSFITSLLSASPDQALNSAKEALGDKSSSSQPKSVGDIKYKFAVIADSHKDYANLTKALKMAKAEGVKFVVGMGDFSDVGISEELMETRKAFDESGLTYYATPGDHDLWDSRNKNEIPNQNFNSVFGSPYQAVTVENARIILVYNSDNYLGLDGVQLNFVEDEVKKASQNPGLLTFVFLSVPLYHPSSDHVMGKVTPKLKDQAAHLLDLFKKNGADEVFSADTHFFSRYEEPSQRLNMTTVGAVTSDRNPQTPRFTMVEVYTDGSYDVKEVTLN